MPKNKRPTNQEFKEALQSLGIPLKKSMALDVTAETLLFSATEEEVEYFLQKMDELNDKEKGCLIGLLLAHGRTAFGEGTKT